MHKITLYFPKTIYSVENLISIINNKTKLKNVSLEKTCDANTTSAIVTILQKKVIVNKI